MEGLRKRHASTQQSRVSIEKAVTRLDLFPKVDDEYVIQTKQGGYVTVISVSILVLLLFSELYAFFVPKRSDWITVRDSGDDTMFINFNLTLYNITCGKVLFDYFDEDGVHPFDSSSHLTKLDLDIHGRPIGFSRSPSSMGHACGSCFGAGIQNQKCCNTCEAILTAYKERGWDSSFVRQFSRVCNPDQNRIRTPHVGCMIWGAIRVHQVAGSIHIAARSGLFDRFGNQVYDADIIRNYNSSHRIHHFSFGDPLPGVRNPLQNRLFLTHHLTSHAYQMEVLPAQWIRKNTMRRSNEIAVYETDKHVTIGLNHVADHEPGIFFHYSISPFMHVIQIEEESVSYLMIRLFAVIGGMLAVSRMVDHVLYYFRK